MNKSNLIFKMLFFLTSISMTAQQDVKALTQLEIKEVIDSVTNILVHNCIFPDMAEEMKNALYRHLENGRYADVSDPNLFATTLTQDVQVISDDLHLRIMFSPQRISDMRQVVTLKTV